LKEYLIVDGYNVINGWDELRAESVHSLEVSRQKLLDIMSDYQGYKGMIVIVVFDAHYVNKRNLLENNINPKVRRALEKLRREDTKT